MDQFNIDMKMKEINPWACLFDIYLQKKTNHTNSQLKLDLKVAEEWIAVFAFAKIGGRQKSPIR